MVIPKTYEEFLKTPNEKILEISLTDISLEEAQIFISYMDRANKEFGNKVISEEKNKKSKSIWERYCE